jgi:hypothetical protein
VRTRWNHFLGAFERGGAGREEGVGGVADCSVSSALFKHEFIQEFQIMPLLREVWEGMGLPSHIPLYSLRHRRRRSLSTSCTKAKYGNCYNCAPLEVANAQVPVGMGRPLVCDGDGEVFMIFLTAIIIWCVCVCVCVCVHVYVCTVAGSERERELTSERETPSEKKKVV